MKKNTGFLIVITLAVFLAGFAFDQLGPIIPVHALSESGLASSSMAPMEAAQETAPPAGSLQPAVFVIIGLAGVLFGILAFSPLFVEDPMQILRDANRRDE